MKRIILAAIFLLTSISFISLNAQWARTYGDSSEDYAYSIQPTRDGGYIVGGTTQSFGVGYTNFWVLKLTSNGDIDWQHIYGGSGWDAVSSIQQTGDGGYVVTGYTWFGAGEEDFWVLKLYSSGDIEWQHAYGGRSEDYAYSVQETGDGGYIIAGYTKTSGAGEEDFWVVKLTSNGDIEWQRTYGGSYGDRAHSIKKTSDGGYIVTGYTQSFGAGKADFWVLKLTLKGDIEWQRSYGGSENEYANSIQQTGDEGYIIAGYTESFGAGEEDFWVLKLSSNGDIEWQRTYGGSSDDRTWSIQQTNDEGYIVAGKTESFGAGKADSWVLKLTSNGDIEWQRTYGDEQFDHFHAIHQITNEGYIATGSTYSFGAGKADLWVLKLSSNGDVDRSCGFIGISNALVSDTSILPFDTNVIPMNTNVISQSTDVLPQETDVTANLLCEFPGKKKGVNRR